MDDMRHLIRLSFLLWSLKWTNLEYLIKVESWRFCLAPIPLTMEDLNADFVIVEYAVQSDVLARNVDLIATIVMANQRN